MKSLSAHATLGSGSGQVYREGLDTLWDAICGFTTVRLTHEQFQLVGDLTLFDLGVRLF